MKKGQKYNRKPYGEKETGRDENQNGLTGRKGREGSGVESGGGS